MSELRLAHGLRFQDLYDPAGLARIDGLFVEHLRASDEGLAGRLMAARAEPASLDAKAESALIIAAAAHVDDFLGELFGIKDELSALRKQHTDLAPLYSVKRLFVQRRALKAHNEATAAALDADAIRAELTPLIGGKFDELSFATHVDTWLKNEANHAHELDLATKYAAWATQTPAGKALHRKGVLFKAPRKVDPMHLVHLESETRHGIPTLKLADDKLRAREAFHLTDQGMDLNHALDQVNYCIFCHNQGKDSCSTRAQGKGRHVQEERVRRDPRRLPARGKDLRDAHGEGRWPADRRARHHRHRQSDVRGDRPSHLQRLHEVVHLPEAGPGRYSPGRNAVFEGCARPALGLRDLWSTDALEPA